MQVCQAVQHAHQRGIIHRDLKPSNVLVAHDDTVPVPKIIDFGVAKATSAPGGSTPRLVEHTLYTHLGQFVGTPLYGSPEQAALNHLDVDTRSDVYSLGVLLYELLTGSTPFDANRIRTAGPDEWRRILKEEEPPTVSERMADTWDAKRGARSAELDEYEAWSVGAEGGAQKTKSALRSTLRAQRIHELDWIVMKALEKDRRRRYESASAFAADVQRYLKDEPVEACPPTAGYLAVKFIAYVCERSARLDQAEELLREALKLRPGARRDQLGRIGRAVSLGWLARNLVLQERFSEAEPLVREAVAIFEREMPNDHRRYYWVSVLGGSPLGQQKYDEAESLLLQGFEGMMQQEKTLIADQRPRLVEAGERLVHYYECLGQDEKAGEWRKALEVAKRRGKPSNRSLTTGTNETPDSPGESGYRP